MACYSPITAYRTPTGVVFSELARHDIIQRMDLPCGQCIGCRMRRASDWELRITHEATLWPHNCFITLTYDNEHLPKDGSLNHKHYADFLKRLRWHATGGVRFYMCGEYGEENLRPHYHACLFNIDFRQDRQPKGKSASGELFYESKQLTQIWGMGLTSVQDLNERTASYCARYIMQKQTGENAKTHYQIVDPDTGEISYRKPEYNAMSLKPGIGKQWIDKYHRDVYPHDYVIQRGVKRQVPKYYDRQLKLNRFQETVEQKRIERARAQYEDQTAERLHVREIVHKAKVKTLSRKLDK